MQSQDGRILMIEAVFQAAPDLLKSLDPNSVERGLTQKVRDKRPS